MRNGCVLASSPIISITTILYFSLSQSAYEYNKVCDLYGDYFTRYFCTHAYLRELHICNFTVELFSFF